MATGEKVSTWSSSTRHSWPPDTGGNETTAEAWAAPATKGELSGNTRKSTSCHPTA